MPQHVEPCRLAAASMRENVMMAMHLDTRSHAAVGIMASAAAPSRHRHMAQAHDGTDGVNNDDDGFLTALDEINERRDNGVRWPYCCRLYGDK